MRKLNKYLALMLSAGVLAGTLAGCGGGGGGGFDMNETEADVTEIYMLAPGLDTYQRDGVDGNTPVYQALKEKLGFDIYAVGGVNSTNWLDRISFGIIDGDLPEIFRCPGPSNASSYKEIIEEGYAIAFDEYVNETTKDIYPNLYRELQPFEYMKSNISYANGHIYFLPTYWGNEKAMYVRTDWIDSLNNKLASILVKEGVISNASQMTTTLYEKHKYKVPDSLTEFYRLARAFTIHDPDNNGSKDTYGYATESNRDYDSWMYVACDTGWKQWMQDKDPLTGAVVDEGTYVHSNTSSGTKIATSIFAKMWAEKLITPSSLNNNEGSKQNQFTDGQAGMMYQQVERYNYVGRAIAAHVSGATQAEKFQNALTKFTVVMPPKGKNGTFGGHAPYGSCYLPGPAINAKMSQARIKKCLEFLEFYCSEEGQKLLTYGVEGINYEVKQDGSIENLNKKSQYGTVDRLTANYDNAAQITYIKELPYESLKVVTNGELIVDLIRQSNASQCASDYIDAITPAAENYIVNANEYFDRESWNMMRVYGCQADWEYDEKTWATDGWSKLYSVSPLLNEKWSAYVSNYNASSGYRGSEMYDEYNAYVSLDVWEKRSGLN